MPLTINQTTTVNVSDTVSTVGTPLAVEVAASATLISEANADRKQFQLHNTTGKTIYLGVTSGVTVSSHWIPIPDNSFYEMPLPIYTGDIYGIVATGTASPMITEFE